MTFGELLRDFLRVASVPATDRWVVQLLNPRLVRYLDGAAHRHALHWPTAADDVLTLTPEVLSTLPSTATRAIGTIATSTAVSATCTQVAAVDEGLTLYGYRVAYDGYDEPP
ncbi:hypothetical protein GCM10022399_42070 [Terrabacter ginsenosidimutans]|uniref:Uncharacterized protein n=1 Tax=Terrabacter ginsenosidimutans TaxID=490575 RepID=A0ABP7EM49_9MICO